ncbi:hypothetical protein [Paraburkholderia heleia]|uniref:hypothetical protein n=1 Tax=Paraburkholderia heleia TaxID=634127 RepID=UPI000B10415E|nr:hypothetical protein [Paraburkholderia heleia]
MSIFMNQTFANIICVPHRGPQGEHALEKSALAAAGGAPASYMQGKTFSPRHSTRKSK